MAVEVKASRVFGQKADKEKAGSEDPANRLGFMRKPWEETPEG